MRVGKALGLRATRVRVPFQRLNALESITERIDRLVGDQNPRHTVLHRLAGAAMYKSDDWGSACLGLDGDHPEIFGPRQQDSRGFSIQISDFFVGAPPEKVHVTRG